MNYSKPQKVEFATFPESKRNLLRFPGSGEIPGNDKIKASPTLAPLSKHSANRFHSGVILFSARKMKNMATFYAPAIILKLKMYT
ncbi:MAG TPA: hypothetical protein DDW43_03275 [Nitrosomonas sp.]|uniref:Uncharacterized protein n=1 Tax=Nitrosomonas europaea (strain ATCC 19718 / CIP 103999 / KCTC 2705 / NBRC 14298) TaxID=228410 RepID=Q82VM3_NITEU|nr:hypothetical protein NE1050 [Nitrosomonas europaea ATCC 19718]HBF24521.1 hypothetical protein [Nitrosomonas sp.]